MGGEDTEAVFLEELARAERHFSGGYVGLNYFLRIWKSRRLAQDFQARNRILQKLVEKGKVETFVALDGNKGLRIKLAPAATPAPPATPPTS